MSAFLSARGDDVVHLVRREPQARYEISWDPGSRKPNPGDLSGLTAVVHLAGTGVGAHRWTAAGKQEIFDSRVRGTASVATALPKLGEPVAGTPGLPTWCGSSWVVRGGF